MNFLKMKKPKKEAEADLPLTIYLLAICAAY